MTDSPDAGFAKSNDRFENLVSIGLLRVDAQLFEDIVLSLNACDRFLDIGVVRSLKQDLRAAVPDKLPEHVLVEDFCDALVAFLLNGVFIWSAVELFNDEKYVTGGIVTFFELGWYSGNIYSAVSSAHKFNKRTKKDFLQGLRDRVNLSYLHDGDNACNYLMLSMKF